MVRVGDGEHPINRSLLVRPGNTNQRGKLCTIDLLVMATHRRLSNIDCLMARTACLVCFSSTVNGRSKKSLGRLALVAGT